MGVVGGGGAEVGEGVEVGVGVVAGAGDGAEKEPLAFSKGTSVTALQRDRRFDLRFLGGCLNSTMLAQASGILAPLSGALCAIRR